MKIQQCSAQPSDWTDLFKLLAKGAVVTQSSHGRIVTVRNGTESLKVSVTDLELLASQQLVRHANGRLFLTEAGENLVSQHSGLSVSVDRTNGTNMFSARNDDESPLSNLRRHRVTDGRFFLTDRQFEAGERLRSDFTRGQLAPRMSANWEASVSSGKRSGGENGIANLTVGALAARQRFEAAIASLGPDLAGAVTDVCCFLKGLEQVELERRWPKRSAKFMLRAGLTLLSMHYDPPVPARPERAHRWGATDYRPAIS